MKEGRRQGFPFRPVERYIPKRPTSEAGQPAPAVLGQPEQLPHDGGLNAPEKQPPKGEQQNPQEQRERYTEKVIDYIKLLTTQDAISFQVALNRVGLLSGLEQAGVLPVPKRHNPYHFVGEAAQHYQWEGEHPEDEEQLKRDFERRDEIVKQMEIGAVLQRYFPNIAPLLVHQEQRKEEVLKHIKRVPGVDIIQNAFFEGLLERKGVLSRLEDIGVLPIVTDPNPFEPEDERGGEWWGEHPEEGERFSSNLERRLQTTKYLYIGALLGRNFPELFTQRKPS